MRIAGIQCREQEREGMRERERAHALPAGMETCRLVTFHGKEGEKLSFSFLKYAELI